jgi:cysteine synthase A
MKKRIYRDISECIGKTPLVSLNSLRGDLQVDIAAKLEFLNPTGSIKDRMVVNIIQDAEKRGLLAPGSVIIESSSGNTGVSLAAMCAVKKYRLIITLPETVGPVHRTLYELYGAELHLTPADSGMRGALEKAEKLKEQIPNAFMIQQFNNPSNPEIHTKTTAVEIWDDTGGDVDIVIAGIGTGGTITGIAAYLKKQKPEVLIIGIEPEASPCITGGRSGAHGIPGIGAGFIPRVLDTTLLDEVIPVAEKDATACVREIAFKTGILAGLSSGAAAWAALRIAEREENKSKLIVTIFPDAGEKYLYMGLLT